MFGSGVGSSFFDVGWMTLGFSMATMALSWVCTDGIYAATLEDSRAKKMNVPVERMVVHCTEGVMLILFADMI